jgi:hypothetical protein
MTDEEQARDLLERASRLPDEIAPPVQQLIQLGRRRRKLRSAQRTLAIGVVAILAAVTPQVINAINVAPAAGGSGPTGVEIAKFKWSALPPSPLGPRDDPLLVAAGSYVVELGGSHADRGFNNGAVFDLRTRRWHKIAAPGGGNVGFFDATAVWTGSELFVTNNLAPPCPKGKPATAFCQPHAGLYNPVTNRWTVTQLPRALKGLGVVAAVWTGRVVVLAALDSQKGPLAVTAYNPATGRWQVITPHLPTGHPPAFIQLIATSNRVIMWSDWRPDEIQGTGNKSGIDVLAFDDRTANPVTPWRTLTGNWPQVRYPGSPVFTGNSILISPGSHWCIFPHCSHRLRNGFFVSPMTLRQTAVLPTGPLGLVVPRYIWADRTIIAVALGRGIPEPFRLTDLSDYDPGTHTWRSLAAVSKSIYTNTLPVWTGSELLVVTTRGGLLALHR